MTYLSLKAIGIMVGMMFGAGIFALPYAFAQAGAFWGVAFFIVAFSVLFVLMILYSEITYFTKGQHRFPGYVEKYLGKTHKKIAFVATVASYYGSLLVYALLAGLFLSNISLRLDAVELTTIFFIVGAFLAYLNLSKVATVNFYLTVPLLGFVVYQLFIAVPFIETSNFITNLSFAPIGEWFLPYGIWLFSLGGFSVLPEACDLFFDKNNHNKSTIKIKKFKRIVIASLTLTAAIYFVFVFSVWGVSGLGTTQDAFSGIVGVLGPKGLFVGSLIGFLAVATSYLALTSVTKHIFNYDYKMPKFLSWVFAVVPPMALFFLGIEDFVTVLGIIGTIGMGIIGVYIIMMGGELRRRIKDKQNGILIASTFETKLKPLNIVHIITLIALITAVVYELWGMVV